MRRAATMVAFVLLALTSARAADVPVSASQIKTFHGKAIGERVGELIWRGGIVLTSPVSEFGGLSGITFTGSGHRLTMASDIGNFVTGHLIYDEREAPLGLGGVEIYPILNSKGVELPRKFAKDAEAIETVYRDGQPAAVRVGFENLTRVADFELVAGKPAGPAREITIPEWLENLRNNRSLEAVCIAPPASPVAGSTLLFAEGSSGSRFRAYMLGKRDRGELSLSPNEGMNPTDCAFLPNGDLLILERGTGLFTFSMLVRRVPAAEIVPGAMLDGTTILEAYGSDIDNMEGIAVHEPTDGDIRITIVSDNNFNDWERTLLLEFSLAAKT